jgi:penicillin-binding protein 2
LFLGTVIFAGLLVLVGKLYFEQIVRHEYWLAKIKNGTDVTVRIPAVRGEIRDRNGVTLAGNRTSCVVEFYLADMVRSYREANKKGPTFEYVGTVQGMKKVLREPDVVKIVNEIVVPRLEEFGLAQDYNSERLRRHFRNQGEVPFVYRESLDFSTFAKISESDVRVPGVGIGNRPVRRYPYGALAAHLLGYVGAVKDLEAQKDIDDFNFYEPDLEGKSQVERACDQWLRGTPGTRVLHRNAKRVIEGEVQRIDPKPGDNVLLTIDARLQFIVERALRDAGIGRGAAVVVNPNNGDILAMASVPSYDPNAFIPSIPAAAWKKLTADETDPLTNRAVQAYAPGSIYKTVTALAELRAGIPAIRTFSCSGGVQYGNKYMKCWIAGRGAHGPLTLSDALKHSCNAYFYQAGNAAGIDQIDAVGEVLGLGKKTGVPLSGESSGVLPGPAWLKMTNPGERWSDGHTANVSIGQGYVLTSPLQMAMVAATIANRGTVFEPRLIYRVVDQNGADAHNPDSRRVVAPSLPKVLAYLRRSGISVDQIEAVREGMRRVVAEGTGKRAQIPGVSVAGKTGTAQFWRGDIPDNHTWFIAFAPFEAPKLALCVMVQGAKSGGGVSAPIAQRILEQGLALDQGYDPGLAAMAPAVGSFDRIDAVDYKNIRVGSPVAVTAPTIPVGIPVPFDEGADPETVDGLEAIPRAQFVAPPHFRRPDIQAVPDALGSQRLKPTIPQTAPGVELRNFFDKPPSTTPAPSGR